MIVGGWFGRAGGIQYLWPELRCPIYATRFAANLAQAKLKDLGFRDEVWQNHALAFLLFFFVFNHAVLHTPNLQIEWRIVKPKETRQIGPFSVTWHPMAHSIPESNAIVLRTKCALCRLCSVCLSVLMMISTLGM